MDTGVFDQPADGETAVVKIAHALEHASAMQERGELAQARAVFDAILGVIPEHPTALNFLGILEYQSGDLPAALARLERSIEVDPNYIDAHNNLGNIYRECARISDAQRCYERALVLDPDFPSALWNLAEIHRKSGDYARAIPLYRKTAAGWPNNPRMLETLGVCLRLGGLTEQAVEVFEQWLAVDPTSPKARHLLAAASGRDVPGRAADGYVRELFDGFAHKFDERLAKLDYRAPQLVAGQVQRVYGTPAAQLQVLDLGCGTGLCGGALRPYAALLIGIDLSKGMLECAARRECYDQLVECELTTYLADCASPMDLIVCTDTLCYLGDLDAFFVHAARCLKAGGRLIFTVESSAGYDTQDYRLCPHGRYSHAHDYLQRSATQTGLRFDAFEQHALRKEDGRPVHGFLAVATPNPEQPESR